MERRDVKSVTTTSTGKGKALDNKKPDKTSEGGCCK